MGKQKTQAEREIAVRVGARIRQLREIQHISQIHLATEIGIRAGPLGWIEKGQHLPSGRVLYRIAKQLNVRIDDLFQESNVFSETASTAKNAPVEMLAPCEISAETNAAKAAHVVCRTAAEKMIELETLCGVCRPSELPLNVAFQTTEAGAESLARWVRQRLGLGLLPASDVVEVFEQAGMRVIFLDMPDGCSTFAAYDRSNQNAFFFVNAKMKKQPEAQVYRIVFELGRLYMFMRKQSGADLAAMLVPEDASLDDAAFAHRFASAFLLPAEALQAAAGQLGLTPKAWSWDLVLRMKKRYGVTAQVFAMRLQTLKLSWSEKQKRSPRAYLFKEEVEAFAAENGADVEPGGNRPALALNGRLCDLLLCADPRVGKETKALNAVKRALRQSGVRLDA